jgi:serine protease Do
MKKLLLALLFVTNVASAANAPMGGFADLVDDLTPMVVNISTTQKAAPMRRGGMQVPEMLPFENFNDLFERFGLVPPGGFRDDRPDPRKGMSLGSGFIIDPEGYVATNYHVINEAEEITVRLSDDREFKAKVIGFDPKTDLALLKVEVDQPLPYVNLGNSEEARVGDWVIAIGNPFGLGGTVTAGIISSRSRDINAGGIVDNFIQTDASINRGSSGGPLFNVKGEVIGINTAIAAPSPELGNVGIGFATPSTLAKTILEQLRKTGKVQRGWLGVKIQPVDNEIVESLGLKDSKGALVAEVSKDSPAAKIGILPGDIILSFDGKEISNERKLPRIVAETVIGKKIDIILLRKGEQKTITATLAELKDESSDDKDQSAIESTEPAGTKNLFGIVIAKLTPELRDKYGISPEVSGVLVVKVNRKGDGITRGILTGDVIVGVNQESVRDIDQVELLVKKAEKQGRKSVLLHISRNGQLVFLPMPLKSKN